MIAANGAQALLSVRDLRTHFPVRGATILSPRRIVKAVDGISFEVTRGQIVSLVGDSGSGKTTAGRSILRLVEPTSGAIRFDGTDLLALRPAALRAIRRRMQIIFQDPFASLNPRMSVGGIIAEGLRLHGIGRNSADRRARVASLLERVGLTADHTARYPHEFSGGQRQTDRDRACAGGRTRLHSRRRACLRARRVDPGAGAESAAGSARGSGADDDLHRP
jgi:oligopeptide transport system ATP-binding protein